MVIGIRHIQDAIGIAQAARLIELGDGQLAIHIAARAAQASQIAGRRLASRNYFDAAVVGVGDIERAIAAALDAQGMLQAVLAQLAIDIAKIEEAVFGRARHHRDQVRLEVSQAYRAGFAVGEVELASAGIIQAARLSQLGISQADLVQVGFAPVAHRRVEQVAVRLIDVKLVRACHGDMQPPALIKLQIPGAAQCQAQRIIGSHAKLQSAAAHAAIASHGHQLARRQICPANGVVVDIGDVERIARQRHPLRLVQLRLVKAAIGKSARRAANDVDDLATRQLDHDDAIMAAVSDEEPPARRVSQQLARVEQGCAGVARAFQCQGQGLPIDDIRVHAVIVGDHAAEIIVESLKGNLARLPHDAPAQRIDDDHRGPGIGAISTPDQEILVIHNRMVDAIAPHDLTQVFGLAFGIELGGMYADHHHFIRVFLLDPLQHGDDMQTVDAAIGPEVQDDDLARQAAHRQRIVDIDPIQLRRELGRLETSFVELFRAALRQAHSSQRQRQEQNDRSLDHDQPPHKLKREHKRDALLFIALPASLSAKPVASLTESLPMPYSGPEAAADAPQPRGTASAAGVRAISPRSFTVS